MILQHPGVHAFMVRYFTEDGHPVKGVQKQIAQYVGVSQASVSRWFAGATTIDPSHWKRLAETAGTDTDTVRRYVKNDPTVVGPDEILTLIRKISAGADIAVKVAAKEHRDLVKTLEELRKEMAALTELVRDAIAARAAHTPPATPAPPRSSRESSRSRA